MVQVYVPPKVQQCLVLDYILQDPNNQFIGALKAADTTDAKLNATLGYLINRGIIAAKDTHDTHKTSYPYILTQDGISYHKALKHNLAGSCIDNIVSKSTMPEKPQPRNETSNSWHLGSCVKCSGDVYQESVNELKCFQCGTYYYPNQTYDNTLPEEAAPSEEKMPSRRGRKHRTIDNMVDAAKKGDKRWHEDNKAIIKFLEDGWSISAISMETGKGRRQVRYVQERWKDSKNSDDS